MYDPELSRDAKERIGRALLSQRPTLYERVPLVAEIELVFQRPKAFRKGPREPHTARPDADNAAKLILDAAEGLCFRNDSQIVLLKVWKWYGATDEKPHSRLRIAPA